MLTIPDVPYAPIVLQVCQQGVELVGEWPRWWSLAVEPAMDLPRLVDGAISFPSYGQPRVTLEVWQGFAWDRRGGFIEVRTYDQRARYRVIDVISRELACRLEEVV